MSPHTPLQMLTPDGFHLSQSYSARIAQPPIPAPQHPSCSQLKTRDLRSSLRCLINQLPG